MQTIKVVIAPQAFKDSLGGPKVAQAMAKGVRAVWRNANIVSVPIADGGDGTLDILIAAQGGNIVETATTDALGRACVARWGIIENEHTAVIETAEANGIAKLSLSERNALTTTTYGIGEIFSAALERGCRKLIVGIGGSATNDGGAGLAQAMGAVLLDKRGNHIKAGGINLTELDSIDLSKFDKRVQQTEILVSCDVSNPLCGPDGAAAVFGPQKGASVSDVARLDAALAHWADIIQRDLGIAVADMAGAGAAGGLGAGLVAFFGARLMPGADLVLDTIQFDETIRDAQLVIVGEGKFDHSSNFNKAPVTAAKRAKQLNIPVIGIGGSIGDGYQAIHDNGIGAVFSIINRPMSLNEAIQNAPQLITQATEQACRAFALGNC